MGSSEVRLNARFRARKLLTWLVGSGSTEPGQQRTAEKANLAIPGRTGMEMTTPWWKLAYTVGQLRIDLTIRAGEPVTPDEKAEASWTHLMMLVGKEA